MSYYRFSEFLKNKYGAKVYKLPVNLPATCPNRDGKIGREGCIFCGEEGADFECLPNTLSVKEQLARNSAYISRNYNCDKFIAYFQNYSNTYLPFNEFENYLLEACVEGIAAIYISTRPDCVGDEHLDFLAQLRDKKNVDIVLELGLQTVNYKALEFLNRGHTLAEFIDAVIRTKRYGLDTCAHYIVDLPIDSMDDVMEGAKILSALGVNQVKCHSLYILKDTRLGEMFEKGKIKPVSLEEYVDRIITFLEYLSPDIVIQRLLGRAPEERALFCNWSTSWWKIRDMIEQKMKTEARYQGSKFAYLGGSACMR